MRNHKEPSEPADPWDSPDPPLALAEEQMRWFARHRNRSRVAYQVSEVLILLTAAATTLAAALKANPWMTASLAATSLIFTGLRKIFDWHEDWVSYGSAWAELRAAINDYRLLPDDRRGEEERQRLLDTVNETVNGETNRWAARRRRLAGGGD